MSPPSNSRDRSAPQERAVEGAVGAVIDVRVDGLAPGGDAVGRQEGGAAAGRATFVALAAPGDQIRARLTRSKARVAWAELLSVKTPSAERVAAPCPLFGHCGGCQWQHVTLKAQRAAKREIVARALGLPVADVVMMAVGPGESGQGYRERAQLVVGGGGAVGFRARRSHEVVDVERCLLLAPALQRALEAIRSDGPSFAPGTEIDLQAGREGVHVAVRVGRGGAAGAAWSALFRGPGGMALPAAWRDAGVVGARVVGARGEVVAVGGGDVNIAGDDEDEGPLRIPAGAFAQVGRAANQALRAVVLDAVGHHPGATLELYAGSGNFTRGLLARATRVVACDSDGAAVDRGRKNAAAASWMNRPPAVVDADTVVLDPPREGLDGENFAAAVRARQKIVYVSCDPQTLGRDAARLAEAGFVLQRAVALDLMPHTYHVEVVATFERE